MKTVAQMLASKPQQSVHTVAPEASMLEALRLMAEHNIGALPVTDAGRLVGIVSERDYARKGVLLGRSSVGTAVREVMSVPVVEGERLLGLLSIGDLVKETLAEQDGLIQHLEQYIRGE